MLTLQVDGTAVRRRREELGMSVAHLADLVGRSPSNIYKIERGHHQPSAEVYARLRLALKASKKSLLIKGAS